MRVEGLKLRVQGSVFGERCEILEQLWTLRFTAEWTLTPTQTLNPAPKTINVELELSSSARGAWNPIEGT